MSAVEVLITDGPLRPRGPEPFPGAGAIVVFEGVVRGDEGGRPIDALEYRAYQPMAQTMLARIAGEVATARGLIALRVEHSRGRVAVGEVSFRLVIASPHRKEALGAMDEFIDRLKRDVPIWKRPVGRDPAHGASPASSTPNGP